MSGYPATHFCKQCEQETPHSEELVRKTSSYDTDTSLLGRIKVMAHTFINGGHYYGMDRYVTCKVCGHKEKDNWGKEFE
ncbi:hypothetical protein VISI1226_02582 [Vibrio sinaloensis DSM 21326]|uniref:Uncharacterized protein n=1 Tax=Vibrio sinaloensis DSM 21326 TaxID=945550 RepID=E8M9R1_PHOS4|nr:hypothetical protein [Vibrio sinaloensis]EGA69252.1 hypothetical protein VISI1226_02582 [Vibrio sinaloensis DSM 21326]